jgi:hypothetical protein
MGRPFYTLGQLSCATTRLAAPFPPELGNLTSGPLDFSQNLLSGNVPASFTNLVDLCEPATNLPLQRGYELNLVYNA